MKNIRVLVTGAGGFIGHHLARYLKDRGYFVIGVDIKYPEYSSIKDDFNDFLIADLRDEARADVFDKIDEVYALAADMGGMGYINDNPREILRNNLLINLNTAEASKRANVKRLFFSSSACVYPEHLQMDTTIKGLKEEDAYPANPDLEYGWEKLIAERIYTTYKDFYEVRIARFHNVYGPEGTYKGGREKAPAALCRKVIEASNELEIWGDGKQTRSFLYIDDCISGIYKLMQSDIQEPLNIGSDRMVSISRLADMIIKHSGKKIKKVYNIYKPQGVRGRNSDNAKSKNILEWEPVISLENGISLTYDWIKKQIST